MRLGTLLYRPTLVLIIASCCWGIYLGTRWMLGDIAAYHTRYDFERWERKGAFPSDEEVITSLGNIDTALSWAPDNPEYLELKARLLLFKAINRIMDDNEALPLAEYQAAAELHRHALRIRPRWPYSWANLALVKSSMAEIDTEFDTALRNASQFGPWEMPVQLTTIQAGAMSWQSLALKQQRSVASVVDRGLVYQFKEVAEILDAYGQRVNVCALLESSDKVDKLCKI